MDRVVPSRLAVITVFLGLGLAAAPTQAGTDSWSVVGQPPGTLVSKVVIDPATPSTLYAATQNGVYESTDSGANWRRVLSTLNPATDIAIEPEKPATLYTAYSGGNTGGIYKSTDSGATWATFNSGIGTLPSGAQDSINHISVDPVTDGIAYATGNSTGIYKTTDGGKNWVAINTGLTSLFGVQNGGSADFGAVVVDPANTLVLYLPVSVFGTGGPSNQGIYQSVNGGTSWTYLSGFPTSASAVVIDPNVHTHLFGLPATAAATTLLYTSSDSGMTWSPVSGVTTLPSSMGIDPTNSLHMVVGTIGSSVITTTDGSTWGPPTVLGSDGEITSIAIDPSMSSNVYAAGFKLGVFKSADGGATWKASNGGIYANYNMQNMIMGGDGVIYAGNDGAGVFKSADHGATWTTVNNGLTPSADITITSLVEDPKTTTTVYAGTIQGLFKTTDGGTSWSLLNNGITDTYTLAVAVDPEQGSTVFDGTNTGGVFKSTDGGGTWSAASTGLPSDSIEALAVSPTDSAAVYAGTRTHGLYRSTDGGMSWSVSLPSSVAVIALALDPSNPKNVYVSLGDASISKSTDGGVTWNNISIGPAGQGYYPTALIFDPANTSTVYAVVPGFGTSPFVSTDGGSSWTGIGSGLPTQPFPVAITAMVLDPQHPTNLYGAGSDGQAYAYANIPVSNPPPPPSGGGGGGGALGWLSVLMLLWASIFKRQRR